MRLNLQLPAGQKTLVCVERRLCSGASSSLKTLLISSFSISASLFLSVRFQRGFYLPTKTHSQPHQKHTSGRLKSPREAKVQHLTKETYKQSENVYSEMHDVDATFSVSSHGYIIKAPPRRVVPKKLWRKRSTCLQVLQ